MSAIATEPAPVPLAAEKRRVPRALSYCVAGGYALLVIATVLRHEPWADEAQAWLLARDAGLADLWFRLMHYEGSPGIWQTLLHLLARLGFPYPAYNFLPAALSFSAVWMLIRYAPLPLAVRLSLPFTYFLCYQYAVVARSYSLLAPLLFGTALLFRQVAKKPFLFTAMLSMIAGISVHGVVISGSIWLAAFLPIVLNWRRWTAIEKRHFLSAATLYLVVVLGFMLSAWPAKDVAFAEHRGLENLHFLGDVVKGTLAGAFTGDWITSLAVLGLTAPFLWRGGGWLVMLLVTVVLLVFGTLVYAQVWHFGIFFLTWLFAIWISAQRTTVTLPVLIALGAVIACQAFWTAQTAFYDWGNPYSGSLEAARYFRKTGIPPGGLYAIGYPCTALQPYFSKNIYSDFDNGGRAAYWDWSKRNTADEPTALFSSRSRGQVLVGYNIDADKARWSKLLNLLGYKQIRHFDGKIFWQSGVFESQAYDLYRREPRTSGIEAVGRIDLADPAEATQLLSGFYPVEMNSWRWAAKKFSVALKPPPGSERTGAILKLKIFLPPIQIQLLGPVKLHADVDGYPLQEATYAAPGAYTFSAFIPSGVLKVSLVTANFYLDKAVANMKNDPRELGTVVTAVGFEPPAKQ